MGEYYMNYMELSDVIDTYIEESKTKDALKPYRAAIMSALTVDSDPQNRDTERESIALWGNQDPNHSEALWGRKYIPVNSIMLSFIKIALKAGLIDAIISKITGNSYQPTMSVSSCIAIASEIRNIISSIKTLDNGDFCVFMQAVTHFGEKNAFSESDLRSWMPTDIRPVCNMHNDTWECSYLGEDDDRCSIREGNKLRDAINSLLKKGILIPETEHGSDRFRILR